jgi:SAM-dependent methyltransferase
MYDTIRGGQALERLLALPVIEVETVLDVGSGDGVHAAIMRAAGKKVWTVSLEEPADYVGDFADWQSTVEFDAIWACHVFEHQPNAQQFLKNCRKHLRLGGVLAITVPPAKHNIVGGHVSIWNAGLLLYNLILAGFDCSEAQVGSYGYNISVIVRRGVDVKLPRLTYDHGDIIRLGHLFPTHMVDGTNGELQDIGWCV